MRFIKRARRSSMARTLGPSASAISLLFCPRIHDSQMDRGMIVGVVCIILERAAYECCPNFGRSNL